MFSIDDISVYIFNWKKVTNNSLKLYEKIHLIIKDTFIINCDENTKLDDKISHIQLDDTHYYGSQYNHAIKHLGDNRIFCVIVGDNIADNNFENIFNSAINIFNNYKVGIYAPYDKRTDNKKIIEKHMSGSLYEVSSTDCGFWFINPFISSQLKNINYSISKFGWGIDIYTINYSNSRDYLVLRDHSIETDQLDHTCGYSIGEAHIGMKLLKSEYRKLAKIYFSFSLYGSKKMYTKGMIENANILTKRFPNAIIQIYICDDVPTDIINTLKEIPSVTIIYTLRKEKCLNMFDRFHAIDELDCDIMFVRDADSRVHERDIACIEDFIKSDKSLHIIRDHHYHRTQILGGLWGICKSVLSEPIKITIQNWLKNKVIDNRGTDQIFLHETIYKLFKNDAMIHDRYKFYEPHNMLTPFRVEIKNGLFCGQVHNYDSSGKEYTEFTA